MERRAKGENYLRTAQRGKAATERSADLRVCCIAGFPTCTPSNNPHAEKFQAGGSLCRTAPLAKDTTLLMTGSITNQAPEPMAWTHQYKRSRIFYTSLGHRKDFDQQGFRQLLVNAIYWALEMPPQSPKADLAERTSVTNR